MKLHLKISFLLIICIGESLFSQGTVLNNRKYGGIKRT